MSITVGGKALVATMATGPPRMTQEERNALECMRTRRKEADALVAQVRAYDARLARLDERLADPTLATHPKRDDAVRESIRVAGERVVWIDRINDEVNRAVTYWRRLSTVEALDEAFTIWGVRPGARDPGQEMCRWDGGLNYVPPRRLSSASVNQKAWEVG
ncbi:MAG: hypothetical protein WKF80_10250 [Thermomicrobiales bacterium]